jgi:hypothetical protein
LRGALAGAEFGAGGVGKLAPSGHVPFVTGEWVARLAQLPRSGKASEQGRGGSLLPLSMQFIDGGRPGRGPVKNHRIGAKTPFLPPMTLFICQQSTLAMPMMLNSRQCTHPAAPTMLHGRQCTYPAVPMMLHGRQCTGLAAPMRLHGRQCTMLASPAL